MTRLRVPDHVRESHAPHGGSVLMDVRSGHCFAMNPMAQALWQEWRRSRDFDSGVHVITNRYPEPYHDRIRQDARQLVDALMSRGLLAAGSHETETPAAGVPAVADNELPRGAERHAHGDVGDFAAVGPASTPADAEVPMVADPVRPNGAREGRAVSTMAVGLLGLLLALLLIRMPFRTVLRVVAWTERRWCRREATPSQGAASLTAVRRAAVLYPGRAACLEVSLATLMVLAITKRRAVWCIGTAVDPYRFHAWTETQGIPIRPPDEYGNDAFRRILSV